MGKHRSRKSRGKEERILKVAGSNVIPNTIDQDESYRQLLSQVYKEQNHARRAIVITFSNLTTHNFTVGQTVLKHGMWTLRPPHTVPSDSTVVFGSQSHSLIPSGTAGTLIFSCQDIRGNISLSWKIPFMGEPKVVSDVPEVFSLVLDVNPSSNTFTRVSVRIKNLSEPKRLEPATTRLLEHLRSLTKFDNEEIAELYEVYKSYLSTYGVLTIDDFRRNFTEFCADPAVLNSVFTTFDEFHIPDNTIDFEEFCRGLSVMTRGSTREKIELAFRICDLDGNGFVEKDEVLHLTTLLSGVMSTLGFESEVYGDPTDIVHYVFQKPQEEGLLDRLSKEEFINRALKDSDLSDCFGLFPYFRNKIINPIEIKLGRSINFSDVWGWYTPRKTFRSLGHKHYFLIRDGFMAFYKHMEHENPKTLTFSGSTYRQWLTRPRQVINLRFAVIEEFSTHFILRVPGLKSRKIVPPTAEQKKNWVNAIRSNTSGGLCHRFKSFAPPREGNTVRWFVNAGEYFPALKSMILRAKRRIFIADWWIVPWVYLERKNPMDKNDRLDNLLLAKAKEGVDIYVLVWNGSSIALSIDSVLSVKTFNSLHRRIKCVAHPAFTPVTWSHHQKIAIVDDQVAFVGGVDLCYYRFDDHRYFVTDPNGVMWPGKDYGNLCFAPETNGKDLKDLVDRKLIPRMPWHDIMMMISGPSVQDVVHNFIARWNHAMSTTPKWKKVTHLVEGSTYLIPLKTSDASNIQLLPEENIYQGYKVQILRSISSWSCGLPEDERSIYKAYMSSIKNAQYYIHIENQYFITSIDGELPKNRIARAIFTRVCKAIENNETFRVVVILPVFPAGSLADISTKTVTLYQFRSICRSEGSLLDQLKQRYPHVDIGRYVSFHCLRNWGILLQKYVHEQIYVHAKIMLVDDRIAIIGSANINDRSMRGSRDSEIAAYIEPGTDDTMIDSQMNGQPFRVSKFVHELRLRLWRDYLGNGNVDMYRDPVVDQVFMGLWKTTSTHNSQIYLNTFKVLPERVKKADDYSQPDEVTNPDQLNMIRGYIVDFPCDFLTEEPKMEPTIFDKEYVLPLNIFV